MRPWIQKVLTAVRSARQEVVLASLASILALVCLIGLLIFHPTHIHQPNSKPAAATKSTAASPKKTTSDAITTPTTKPSTTGTSTPTVLTPPATAPKTTLFSEAFNGPDRIFTNAGSYYSKSCPYSSPNWMMTSGTLLIKNGVGYSGIPTSEASSACNSQTATGSAVFRLNTTRKNFGNVRVSVDYNVIKHGGANAQSNVFDGIHIWVGYQDEYNLYAATIFRWDDILVTKKKVSTAKASCTDPSNGGCYYNLSSENKNKTFATTNTWHHAEISYRTDAASQHVTIQTSIDGTLVNTATDTGDHATTYASGSVGIRGDDTEFYVKNFVVTSY